MINASEYSIEVRKGNFDGEVCFQARVKEIPYLEEYADSFEEAYALVIDSIEQTAALMAEQHKPMPAPLVVESEFSGRVTLRIPKTLHRYLAGYAEIEEISLNSFLSNILANFRGFEAHHDVQRKDWFTVGALPKGGQAGQVERRISQHSKLKVVGGSSYISEVA